MCHNTEALSKAYIPATADISSTASH